MIDRAQTLARAAAGDIDAQAEAFDIFMSAMRAYFRADGDLSLERRLGLPGPTARTLAANLRRNYWITVAHGQIDAASPWKKSQGLALELGRFEETIWPVWCELDAPPTGASALREALFHALRAAHSFHKLRGGSRMPRTARWLHDVVKNFADANSQTG